ncbi:MAG: hypothetical protein KC432_14880 [Thermomicrobiales bacterium]|nr:hypothetical protein [Thermomicrobiales bacterium]
MAGRLLFPAFPNKRVLPWVLAGLGVAGVGAGFLLDDSTLITVGTLALGGVGAGYGLSRIVLGERDGSDEQAGPPT